MSDIEQIADYFEQQVEDFNVPREYIYKLFSELPDSPYNKKKRGAPFGNQNARKHGLYSKFLTPERIKVLEQAAKIEDLSHEITLVRLKLNDLLADPEASTDEMAKMASILTKLVSTQRRHFEP